ncbi:MAG TPA: hypothetical protein PLD10_12115 [Rhodopila sp.]|nr:hypothetical protein [Rhodopila sp.]
MTWLLSGSVHPWEDAPTRLNDDMLPLAGVLEVRFIAATPGRTVAELAARKALYTRPALLPMIFHFLL